MALPPSMRGTLQVYQRSIITCAARLWQSHLTGRTSTRFLRSSMILSAATDTETHPARRHASRERYGTYLPPERTIATMFAPRLLGCRIPTRQRAVRRGTRTGRSQHISAGIIVGSQLVATGNRTEQRTLYPRVRGSSPGGAPVLIWGFCYLFILVGGRFWAMVAPRLLVSPNIVDHGDQLLGEAPTDGYTQRDIWRKGAGSGIAADAAQGTTGVMRWRHGLGAWDCSAWIASQVHARSDPGRRTGAGDAGGNRPRRRPRSAAVCV